MVCRFFILWYRSADSNGIKCETNDVHINAFLFFLTYFCQIDLETNYLNDYLVDLRTLGLETKFH